LYSTTPIQAERQILVTNPKYARPTNFKETPPHLEYSPEGITF
jgi:hypothetical protein